MKSDDFRKSMTFSIKYDETENLVLFFLKTSVRLNYFSLIIFFLKFWFFFEMVYVFWAKLLFYIFFYCAYDAQVFATETLKMFLPLQI